MAPHANLFLSEVVLGIFFLALTGYNICRTPRETGWWYIAIFCLFRITGSALLLSVVCINRSYGQEVILLIPATVFSGIALSPLLAGCLGFLNSCTQHLPTPHHPILRILALSHVLVFVALILSTVGVALLPTHSSTSTSTSAANAVAYIRTSAIIFLAAWALILLCLLALARHWRRGMGCTGRWYYAAVAWSMPFLLVRVLFAVLAGWSLKENGGNGRGGGRYGVLKGDLGVLAGMRVSMEFLVVAGCVVVGVLEGTSSV
ncbi:hypothetical protein L873DRAFT_1828150 [Choiromyces venosus 120613-1]|uniref:DUF7702 domain-containing protein n=1 Tax=Choiromyces venosus 120613-1 TaxID=1336337 RepID=A0A3N4JLS5_9PEZI|nr:hypothetical protein L873DRAFT_1828150 [Choiromyces venosus 120613-1]